MGYLDVLVSSSMAQQSPNSPHSPRYVVKIICGNQPDSENLQLLRGRYLTAVNILNKEKGRAEVRASLALTNPLPNLTPGDVHDLPQVELDTGKSLATDCGDIKAHVFKFGFPNSYIDGFLVIESTGILSVSAVYTAAPLLEKDCCKDVAGPVTSIDVEWIAPAETATTLDRADLVPLPPEPEGDPLGNPGTGFCTSTNQNMPPDVTMKIANIGTALAGASHAAIDFGTNGGVVMMPVRPLAPGASQLVMVPIPKVCFGTVADKGCEFDVIADMKDAISESLETNNVRRGHCLRVRQD